MYGQGGGVSFSFNKDTYFHKDYSLPATDFQLLMTVHGVYKVLLVERSNDI